MALQWHTVCRSHDLEQDRPLAVTSLPIALAILRIDGELYAVENRCPHMAYPLSEGVIRDGKLVCTWHHWEFDLTQGQCFVNERARCVTYPVRVEGDDVRVGIDLDDLPPPPGGFPREITDTDESRR